MPGTFGHTLRTCYPPLDPSQLPTRWLLFSASHRRGTRVFAEVKELAQGHAARKCLSWNQNPFIHSLSVFLLFIIFAVCRDMEMRYYPPLPVYAPKQANRHEQITTVRCCMIVAVWGAVSGPQTLNRGQFHVGRQWGSGREPGRKENLFERDLFSPAFFFPLPRVASRNHCDMGEGSTGVSDGASLNVP